MDPMNLSNNETVTDADFFSQQPHIVYFYLVFISFATFIGTPGNILVIGTVITNKHLKTTGNMFIVNLALADLCVTSIVDPMSIIGSTRGFVWFKDRPVLCEAVACICTTSCYCSLISICAISFNRYVHICHHQKYADLYTPRNTVVMCLCIWTISFLLQSTNFLGWGDYLFDKKALYCAWDRTAAFSHTLFVVIAVVGIPVILISVCYAKIYLFVRASRKKVANRSSTGRKSEKNSMQLARTLFIIFAVFVICWTPYAITVVADINDDYPQELHIISTMMAHISSSLNFMLYGLTNKQFRIGYLRFLHLDKCPISRSQIGHLMAENSNTAATNVTHLS